MARIGLVAGSGQLPAVFAKRAKERGDTVIAFGLIGITDKGLEGCVDKMHWLEFGNLKKALLLAAIDRIRKIILLGKVKKDLFYKKPEALDAEAKKFLGKDNDKKDYSILNEATKVLKAVGIEVLDSTTYMEDLLPAKGVLTRRLPSGPESEDIEYARTVARELARFDVGQTVVVKDKNVISVEGAEGTDQTIKRSGELAKSGFTVVKVARPNQDMRFDVPLIGLDTLKIMIAAGGKVLAIEEKRVFLMDKKDMVLLADEKDISIVVV